MSTSDVHDQIVAFVDTNILLHYRRLWEIDWHRVLNGKSILIVVCAAVMQECEKKKYEGTPKIKQRAQDVALELRKRLIKVDNRIISEIRSDVIMEFYPKAASEQYFSSNQGLSITDADDRFLAAIIQYKEENPSSHVILISADSGPYLKGLSLNIETVSLAEEWKLPDEVDPKEKRLQQLEQENTQLKSKEPKLTICFEDGKNFLKVRHRIWEHSESKRARMATVREQCPKQRLATETRQAKGYSSLNVTSSYFRELNSHQDEENKLRYNKYMDGFYRAYEDYLKEMHCYQRAQASKIEVSLILKNIGNLAADGVIASILCKYRNVTFYHSDNFPKEPIAPPTPEKYSGNFYSEYRYARSADFALMLGGILEDPRHRFESPADPTKISLPTIEKTEEGFVINYKIGSIMHNIPIKLPPLYLVFDDDNAASSFSIVCSLHSKNMSKTISEELHINII